LYILLDGLIFVGMMVGRTKATFRWINIFPPLIMHICNCRTCFSSINEMVQVIKYYKLGFSLCILQKL